jgi:hypothetical protein
VPRCSVLVAAATMEKALRTLKERGVSQVPGIDMFDFNEFCGLNGFQEVWESDTRCAGTRRSS